LIINFKGNICRCSFNLYSKFRWPILQFFTCWTFGYWNKCTFNNQGWSRQTNQRRGGQWKKKWKFSKRFSECSEWDVEQFVSEVQIFAIVYF